MISPRPMALAVLAVAFAGVGGCSDDPAPKVDRRRGATISDEDKVRILGFWEAFRAAEDLRRDGAWEAALPIYQRALELDPAHEGALYQRANCLVELGCYAEALPIFEELVRVNPISQRGHNQIGLIRSCLEARDLFDLALAEAALTRAVEINPEETGSLLRLAEVKLMRGDEARAVELLELANQSNFRAVEGYYLRAYVAWRRGDEARARALLGEAAGNAGTPAPPAGVAGEGDTRPGLRHVPSTMEDKRGLPRAWEGIGSRDPARVDLAVEFEAIEGRLREVRAKR